MTHTIEAQSELANPVAAAADNNVEGSAPNVTVYVYGHGPTKNPFYEQARALNTTSQGASLILTSAVNGGQKLLLMNGASPEPVEAQVIRTRTLNAQMLEAEVAFTVPQPDFWTTLRKPAKCRSEKRRSPRISLPQGMTISWEAPYRRDISRVSSMSLGGLFIDAEDPAPAGQTLRVQFDIPSGPVVAKAVVRRSVKGKGMGVEFTELPEAQRQALNHLLQQLLGNRRNRAAF